MTSGIILILSYILFAHTHMVPDTAPSYLNPFFPHLSPCLFIFSFSEDFGNNVMDERALQDKI